MVLFACLLVLYYEANHNPDDGSSRPKLFPLWAFGLDFAKTPTYQITFVYTSYTILLYSFTYFCKFQFFDIIHVILLKSHYLHKLTIKLISNYCLYLQY